VNDSDKRIRDNADTVGYYYFFYWLSTVIHVGSALLLAPAPMAISYAMTKKIKGEDTLSSLVVKASIAARQGLISEQAQLVSVIRNREFNATTDIGRFVNLEGEEKA
jgi:hypothetical protein